MQTNRVEKIKHSLELDEKLSHQVQGWRVQKMGAAIILAVVVLTALGLFGNGMLSTKKIVQSGATLQYEKFLRFENEVDIRWEVNDIAKVTFRIPVHYLDHFKVESVTPDGYETAISGGYVDYTFKTAKLTETVVHFYLSPQKTGSVAGTWDVGNQHFQLTHFIYP